MTANRTFLKIGSSSTVKADPAVVHFGGFHPHRIFTQTLKIKNACDRATRVHILPPETPYFRFKDFQKSGFMRPGLGDTITIEFVPTEYRYYYDCVRVQTEDENLLIPIHAYPTMNTTLFPRQVSYLPVAPDVGQAGVLSSYQLSNILRPPLPPLPCRWQPCGGPRHAAVPSPLALQAVRATGCTKWSAGSCLQRTSAAVKVEYAGKFRGSAAELGGMEGRGAAPPAANE